jgi:hypothetical protein
MSLATRAFPPDAACDGMSVANIGRKSMTRFKDIATLYRLGT